MNVIKEKIVKTNRYETILFSHVKDKGWTYQYDSVLTFGNNNNYEDVPRYLDEDAQESGEFMPGLDELDDNCFFNTFEEANEAMLSDMSNNYYMGTIAVFM